jgi:HSP90 family molecular chaperone
MKKRDVEVLFCFEPYDELVLLQLREFDRKQLTSVEKDMRQDSGADKPTDADAGMQCNNLFLLAFQSYLMIPQQKNLVWIAKRLTRLSPFYRQPYLVEPQR